MFIAAQASAPASEVRRSEVLIVGGGPAGAALAIELARRGVRCIVVEKRAAPRRTMGEALKSVGRVLLEELGLWQAFLRQSHCSTALTRVSWAGSAFEKSSDHPSYGPELHVDRASFDAWLRQVAIDAGVVWLDPAQLGALNQVADGYEVQVRSAGKGSRIITRYLVDATGRSLSVGRKLGAERYAPDALVGFCRWYRVDSVEPRIVVEAASSGWWYSSPVPRGPRGPRGQASMTETDDERPHLAVLFVTDPSLPAAKARRAEVWRELLCDAPETARRLLGASEHGAPQGYLAGPGVTRWRTRQRWLPVGDAALSFDPIAADGLCFALRTALEAARHITAELSGRGDTEPYRSAIQRIFADHLRGRASHYRAEARIHPSPFWLRRARSALLTCVSS